MAIDNERKPLSIKFDGERTILAIAVVVITFFGGRLMIQADDTQIKLNTILREEAVLSEKLGSLRQDTMTQFSQVYREIESIKAEARSRQPRRD